LIGAAVLSLPVVGCSTASRHESDPVIPVRAVAAPSTEPPVRTVSYQEPASPPTQEPPAANGPREKVTLPAAVALCVGRNFRVAAGAEQVRAAEADLLTSSLVPNPTLFADYQLIPLRRSNLENQLGPPQADALVSLPVDWLLFGKRVAAMRAARLGVEVGTADAANVLRVQVSQAVDAFYEILEDEAYLKLADRYVEELTELENLTAALAAAGKVGDLERDRAKLAVHEAVLERHDRELAVDLAKAKLRPYLGRTAADPDFEVDGSLAVTAVVPPMKLADAVALAEARRPDLLSGRKSVDQSAAAVELERRRAWPQVSVQPGWSYQRQNRITGFRDGSLFDIGVSTTLPITDRNQGNIRRARSEAAQRQLAYQGDRADALADVEAAVASYTDAVEHLTQFNTADTLKAARDLRQRTDAEYRAGTRKLVEVLDAYRAYHTRRERVVEFESTYWRTLNRLNAAVGLTACDPPPAGEAK
jgi:cobalt-zinc-cadmium efflux system outer membrane protein